MIELFRFIEQSFTPSAQEAIDGGISILNDNSSLQNELKEVGDNEDSYSKKKRIANTYLDQNRFPSSNEEEILTSKMKTFRDIINKTETLNSDNIYNIVEEVFSQNFNEFASSEQVKQVKNKINDLLLAAKISLQHPKAVFVNKWIEIRQNIHFIEQVQNETFLNQGINQIKMFLNKSILIPSVFLPTPQKKQSLPADKTKDPAQESRKKKIEELREEIDTLNSAYNLLMQLHPDELEFKEVVSKSRILPSDTKGKNKQEVRDKNIADNELDASMEQNVLAIRQDVFEKFSAPVKSTFQKLDLNVLHTDLPRLVEKVKVRLAQVSDELQPYLIVPKTNVYQIGTQIFAIQPKEEYTVMADMATAVVMPDFSSAITKPIGIGDLLVVKQELLKYQPGEISHIENILERELYRRETERTELTETIVTEEKETVRSEERDLQSTERNEIMKEAQKEAGRTITSPQENTISTDYGKLVENNKSSFARTVTDRAVNNVTEKIREQRTQRQLRSFTEKSLHEFDNKDGTRKVRGIYQWVDKKYKTKILNYGKRLLYDVVLPEPAALFIESLKNSQKPEAFNLNKPNRPKIKPIDINFNNYTQIATEYEIGTNISPNKEEFVDIIGLIECQKPENADRIYKKFEIQIPDGYRIISGYVQNVNPSLPYPYPDENLDGYPDEWPNRFFELFIGESTYIRHNGTYLNQTFKLNGQIGKIPITFCTYARLINFSIAVGLRCQLTDLAIRSWQLNIYNKIMDNYRRQLNEYEEKLARMQAMVRTQMALAGNFSHNPEIEQTELKRAFIQLLVSEHATKITVKNPDPLAESWDAAEINQWGAFVAFFERAFEWENMMYTFYPYYWARETKWGELILIQDINPKFEAFLKAGAARLVVPVRPGFEEALAHYHETGEIWMGKEMPNMFSEQYLSIIEEIKARNFAPGKEILVEEWDVVLPTKLVMLKEDEVLPTFPLPE